MDAEPPETTLLEDFLRENPEHIQGVKTRVIGGVEYPELDCIAQVALVEWCQENEIDPGDFEYAMEVPPPDREDAFELKVATTCFALVAILILCFMKWVAK
jgi:ABC-type nitrate/sulfonate/bicarbonate transport system substrate-binding protein